MEDHVSGDSGAENRGIGAGEEGFDAREAAADDADVHFDPVKNEKDRTSPYRN